MDYQVKANERPPVDVLVAGGGPAGFGAAVAAAREGLSVLLVEAGGALGGTSTLGALPFWLGATTGSIPFRHMLEQNLQYRDLPHPRRAVGGIFQEAMARMKQEGGGVGPSVMAQTERYPILDRLGCHDEFTFDLECGKRTLETIALEAGVQILYYTMALDVARVGDKVQGVYLSSKDGVTYVPVKAVIDATGDADLVARAGFETYKGDRETGEMTAASLVAHIENIDSGAIAAYLEQGGDPWFYDACAKACEAYPGLDLPTGLIIFPMMQDGVFMINGGTSFGGYDGTSAESLTALTIRGRKRAQLLVEKLFREFMPGGENCRLRLTAAYPGVRETRRIVAEYMLSEQDLLEGKRFEDTIALAGRHFDLSRKSGGQPFHVKRLSVKGGVTPIPYRALIPAGADNLIAAGRCIAADGQALGPARIISTCIAVGEAAGVATRFKLEGNVPFRAVPADALRGRLRMLDAEVDA